VLVDEAENGGADGGTEAKEEREDGGVDHAQKARDKLMRLQFEGNAKDVVAR